MFLHCIDIAIFALGYFASPCSSTFRTSFLRIKRCRCDVTVVRVVRATQNSQKQVIIDNVCAVVLKQRFCFDNEETTF